MGSTIGDFEPMNMGRTNLPSRGHKRTDPLASALVSRKGTT